jgi:pimeloyl-ACP methyl ester carboxylesterase
MSNPHPPRVLKSHISSDIFLHVPASPGSIFEAAAKPPPRIIFFVTGNPGLIAYYHAFLSILSTTTPTSECVLVGFSLGGFEIGDRHVRERRERATDLNQGLEALQFPDGVHHEGKIWGLEEQIGLTERRVRGLVKSVYDHYSNEGIRDSNDGSEEPQKLDVILLGHSVGAYIVLELLRRHAEEWKSKEVDDGGLVESADFNIKGAVLLTPTVFDIAQSQSGRVLTPLVEYVPGFAMLVAAVVRVMGIVLPRAWLRELVRRVTGMPDQDGEASGGRVSALDATVAFLRSVKGVRQALEMAGEEMRTIREDKWGEEVWGAANTVMYGRKKDGDLVVEGTSEGTSQGTRTAKLVFYFAKTDHWIADQTKDDLLKFRGRLDREGEDWKPRMVVDNEDGLVHGWCIGQSELVAGKVRGWVEEILGKDEDTKLLR